MVIWPSDSSLNKDVETVEQQRKAAAVPLVFDSVETAEWQSKESAKQNEDAVRNELAVELEERLEEQRELTHAQIEFATKAARDDERSKLEDEYKSAIEEEREKIKRVCESLDKERRLYFDKIEEEVVKLSIAIAARILHRETNLDPTMLRGAVRAALGKIQSGSEVTLVVPESDEMAWVEHFESGTHSFPMKIMPDEHLKSGECHLKTDTGTVTLGVEAQLVEIERGFFDLLKQRPA